MGLGQPQRGHGADARLGVGTPQSSAGASRDLLIFSRKKFRIAPGCFSGGGGLLVFNTMRLPPASRRAAGSNFFELHPPPAYLLIYKLSTRITGLIRTL